MGDLQHFDNTVSVSVDIVEFSDASEIAAWCEEFIGLSWHSPKPGPKMWRARSIPYVSNSKGVAAEISISFVRQEDATLFALRWVK